MPTVIDLGAVTHTTLVEKIQVAASGNGPDIDIGGYKHAAFYLDVLAAASDAADKLDVAIEAKHIGTARYTTIASFTQVAGTAGACGERVLLAAGDVLPDSLIRAKFTVTDGGGTHTFTFAVYAVLKR